MKRKPTRAERAIDRDIERIYVANCHGVQIKVLDIEQVFIAGRMAAQAAADRSNDERAEIMTHAILAKVAELRQN